MITWILALQLAATPTVKPPAYPYPPANPCSNPFKCDRYRPQYSTPQRPLPWKGGPRK